MTTNLETQEVGTCKTAASELPSTNSHISFKISPITLEKEHKLETIVMQRILLTLSNHLNALKQQISTTKIFLEKQSKI